VRNRVLFCNRSSFDDALASSGNIGQYDGNNPEYTNKYNVLIGSDLDEENIGHITRIGNSLAESGRKIKCRVVRDFFAKLV